MDNRFEDRMRALQDDASAFSKIRMDRVRAALAEADAAIEEMRSAGISVTVYPAHSFKASVSATRFELSMHMELGS